jgi:hypothetical protein
VSSTLEDVSLRVIRKVKGKAADPPFSLLSALNPARSIGPDIVIGQFDFYHWIYWLGPAMGAALAVAFWKGIQYGEFFLLFSRRIRGADALVPLV